jgi:cystathionine beta-lyase/cystathionine gamma-synthase
MVRWDVTSIAVYWFLTQYTARQVRCGGLVDTCDRNAVRAAAGPDTVLVHIETPANPMLRV